MISRIDPLPKAILKTLGVVALPTLCLAWGFRAAYPGPDFMYTLAQVGIAIVFAFVVEAVWMVERVDPHEADHRDWLGTACGFAIAGLLGVAFALAVGAHRDAGHANLLDAAGLWWSIVSLVLLGGLVVIQPLLVDLHRAKAEAKSR
jgi:hypothetical protein